MAERPDWRGEARVAVFDAALRASVERAFEGLLAQPIGDACAGEEVATADRRFVARIVLRGEGEAHFCVSCTETAVRHIATTLLCVESPDELGPDEVLDALGEFANVVAGGVKTTVFDGNGAWQLGTPACAVEETGADEPRIAAVACKLAGGVLAVGLRIQLAA